MKVKQEEESRDIFNRYLKNKRMVLTIPREIILRTVFTMPPHFTADELAERLKEGEDRVSRGTVYRTLHFIEEAGIIRNLREPPYLVFLEIPPTTSLSRCVVVRERAEVLKKIKDN